MTTTEPHVLAAELQPGMFFYSDGQWLYSLSAAQRTRNSSWWTIDVLTTEGARNPNYRLHYETVPATTERPRHYSTEAIQERISRREKRIELWQKEIAQLEKLRGALEGKA